ncbi:hypothetical protein NXW59_00175 [Bacteroides fragilis]|nr:hypothetical protein [Bacteroides fragilis]
MKKEKGINPFHEIIKMLFLIEREKERQGKEANIAIITIMYLTLLYNLQIKL